MARPSVRLLPPNGDKGSPRGRAELADAVHALRCEGVDPWGDDPTNFAPGHSDIPKGAAYIRLTWEACSVERVAGRITRHPFFAFTRHCAACAEAVEAANPQAIGSRDRGGRFAKAEGT